MHIRGTPCEHESRHWASRSQGMVQIVSKPPEARREAWDRAYVRQ